MSEKKSRSLSAFIEQTARMLRDVIHIAAGKTREPGKETDLSNKNKIEQIASLLRSEAKKSKMKKKRKN